MTSLPPKSVNRFEAKLIRLLRCFVRQAPLEPMMRQLSIPLERPRCLSRSAVELIQESLGKGCMLILAHAAWRKEKFLRNSQPRRGRLWERSTPNQLGLEFSANSLEMLIWITESDLNSPKSGLEWDRKSITAGDRFLSILIYETLRDVSTPIRETLVASSAWKKEPLLRLLYPEDFPIFDNGEFPDFAPWMTPQSAWLLEALQPVLRDRLIQVEGRKRQIREPSDLHRTGGNQLWALQSLASALKGAGRLDLARFIMQALNRIVRWYSPTAPWFLHLNMGGLRLVDRAEIYRQGLGTLQFAEQLRQWQMQARDVLFYDEDYQASQLWKEIWEKENSEEICTQALAIVQAVQPLAD